MALLRLIRLPNLLIVALTQGLLYFLALMPAYDENQVRPTLDPLFLGLLCGVTLLLTAGGYIINDIEDEKTDLANRPDRVIVGKRISRQVAIWLYALASISGFLLALFIAFQVQKVKLLFLYPLALGILYWYSKTGQKLPLIGNLVISLFCAGVAGIIWAAEWPGLHALRAAAPQAYHQVGALFIWYSIFAFLSNLYREMVKDIEDAHGDGLSGAKPCRFFMALEWPNAWL
ncbi:MAG: UbiA family prenyltransferase [Haliscomenobacter sp.]|nr:UbiA family prenyltransferase [Haliscomenobacter sp.]